MLNKTAGAVLLGTTLLLFCTANVIGCVVEYFISWFGETFMQIKWWDYSNEFLNINKFNSLI